MRIILCGFGAVGQSLASLFESRAKELYEMHGLRPRIVGVFDSKGAAFQSSGLDCQCEKIKGYSWSVRGEDYGRIRHDRIS